ncbi:MAG TPA: hypothetical protein VFA28_19110 [Bryobacteraceae bacterium]|jgi:hypothetical protein|nr:hypothetical protein [Bryobacteraceae bacterium]
MDNGRSPSLRRPEGTPVFSAPHRRLARGGVFWRIVGIAALAGVVWLVYYVAHRTPFPVR